MKLGVIGLGAMGWGMAMNLHRANLLESVWNRTRNRAEAFEQETGVVAATDPATLAGRCQVVLICVSEDADLFEVLEKLLPGLGRQSIVIDSSTVDSETARVCAERVASVGAAFLDAPVTGGVEGANKGTLSMMVGGDKGVLELVTPALKSMTSEIVHMGPNGSGQQAKAVNQVMVAGINQAVTQALALGQALELPMGPLVNAMRGGAAGNWFLDNRGAGMLAGRFPAGFKVAHHLKDLRICERLCQESGIEDEVIAPTIESYEQLIKQGHGEEDISALFRLKQK
uniref:Putative 6-phosphogluconate dehydrogenase, NAD-binding n=1 Tax=Magnetococcus massalia (strain MO-1) TaxID=451514 RepID=A0A1S7LDX1_MAGMO|nr:putative 6-phosphogluconate dehydrogenase, NAD-binding [Candidatus Magnetococcus massalia]